MKQSLQKAIQNELPDADYPDFEPGDKIKVTTTQEIQGQQRKRHFEGVCIGRKGEGPDQTFKVRKVSFGVGVERIYPLHSPIIDDIEIVKKGKVRRAKLTYLEGRSAKDSRIDEERVDLEEVNRTRSGSTDEATGEADREDAADETDDEEATEAREDEATEDDGEPEARDDEEEQQEHEDETDEEPEVAEDDETAEAEGDDEADKE